MTQAQAPVAIGAQVQTRRRARPQLGGIAVNTVLIILMILWAIPAIGLLVASFRTAAATNESGWWTAFTPPWEFTIENYEYVLGRAGIDQAFINSFVITIPATVLVVMIAAFAAYAFAWMEFPGRNVLFVIVVGLLVVPLQMALIPILRIYSNFDLVGTFPAIWLAHAGFGLPLAIYLLRNYMGSLPSSLIESAKIDGADHFTIFTRLVVPLSVPVLASFAIFQFLWVWNDFLVALVFLGYDPANRVLTVELSDLAGRGEGSLNLLPAAAFVTMILPLIVFFSLQRFFVRGLTAGSVKG